MPSRAPPRPRRAGAPATIRDVARDAGVGLATVSRALSGSPLVLAATRTRVELAAARLGYRPSRAARVLRGAPARVIGVMVPDLSHGLYGAWLTSVNEVAQRRGYVVVVCDGQYSTRVMTAQLERLFDDRVDGLLLGGSIPARAAIRRFLDAGIPLAPDLTQAVDPQRGDGQPRHLSERAVTAAAYRTLIELGHRRIAFFDRPERDSGYISRLQRMRWECLEAELTAVGAAGGARRVHAADGDDCRARAVALLRGPQAPTALVPGIEGFTPMALLAVTDAGLRVPDDVSLLGFEDSPWEQAHLPPISVVRHDYRGIAAALTENLIARIEGWPSVPTVPAFPSEFVRRGSLAAPR